MQLKDLALLGFSFRKGTGGEIREAMLKNLKQLRNLYDE